MTNSANKIRLFSAVLLGIIIPIGFSLIFFDYGIISFLAPIVSGLALGLVLVSRKSLGSEAVSAMLAGILISSLGILVYVFLFQHEPTFPKIEQLAVAVVFGIGPLIQLGMDWLRRKRRTA